MAANTAAPTMPSGSSDLVTTWAFLEEGVDHIMTKLQTGVSYSKVRVTSFDWGKSYVLIIAIS